MPIPEEENTINKFGTPNTESVYPASKYLGKTGIEVSPEEQQQEAEETMQWLKESAKQARDLSDAVAPDEAKTDIQIQAERSEQEAHQKTYDTLDWISDQSHADNVQQSLNRWTWQTFLNPMKRDESFVMTEDIWNDVTKDVPRMFHHEFESAVSEEDARRIKADIDWRLGMEDRLGREGVAGRFGMAMLDPAFLALMVMTEGVAGATLGNALKSTSVSRRIGSMGKQMMEAEGTAGALYAGGMHLGKMGVRVGTGMAGVTSLMASESPVISIEDVPTAFLHGAAFGGALGGVGMGFSTLAKRIRVPKESHLMTESQFTKSGQKGHHKDVVLKSIEEGKHGEHVVADYFVKEKGLPKDQRPIHDAIRKHLGEDAYIVFENEAANRAMKGYWVNRPESWQAHIIRKYGNLEADALTFGEALRQTKLMWRADKQLQAAKKLERQLTLELQQAKKATPTKLLKDILKRHDKARQAVKKAQRDVKKAEKALLETDAAFESLIRKFKKSPQKYKRRFKDVLEAKHVPYSLTRPTRITGGHGKKTSLRFHRKNHVKGIDRIFMELDIIKSARQRILSEVRGGSKPKQRDLKILKEAEIKLKKYLKPEEQRIIKEMVKESNVIKGRRQNHLNTTKSELEGVFVQYEKTFKIKSRLRAKQSRARFERIAKAREAQSKARSARKKAKVNFEKFKPQFKRRREALATLKNNVKKDIDAGLAIPEAYLTEPNFAKIISNARKQGKEIKTFREPTQGVISDGAAKSIDKLTPKGEKLPKVLEEIAMVMGIGTEGKAFKEVSKMYSVFLNTFDHLGKQALKREARKREIVWDKKTTSQQLRDTIIEHDLVEGTKGLEGYKNMGSLIKLLEKSGFYFRTKPKKRKATKDDRIKMLKEFRRRADKAYEKYLETGEVRKGKAKPKPDAKPTKVKEDGTPELKENDAATSMAVFNKASVIAWAGIRKLFGKIPFSFTAEVGTLETHGALRFIAGETLQDSMARRHPITGEYMPVKFTAESKAIMHTNRTFVEAQGTYGNAESRWFKKNKMSMWDRATGKAEDAFGAEVSKVLRGGKSTDRHVNKAAQSLRKILDDADEFMAETGMIEQAFKDPNFLPRKILPSKVVDLIKQYGGKGGEWGAKQLEDKLVKQAILSGYKKAGEKISEQHADWLAKAWVRNVHKRGTVVDYNSNGFLGESSAATLRDYLKIAGLDDTKLINQILKKTRVSQDSRSPKFLKHRLLMDENFQTTLVDREGNTNIVKMTEFFDNNAKRVVWSHIRTLRGEAAWREIGVKFNEVRGLSTKDYVNHATTKEMWEFIEKDMGTHGASKAEVVKAQAHLERMEAAVKGKPYGEMSELATMARVLQKVSGSIFGGSFGLASIAELGQPLAHSSLKAYLKHVPALKGMIKDIRNGTVSSGLQKELAMLTGIGTEGKAFREIATMFEHYPMGKGEHMNAFENIAGKAQIKVLKYGGLIPIDAVQRQYAATLFVQHLLDSAIAGKPAYTLRRLQQIGLTQADADLIMSLMKKHSTYDGAGSQKLRLLNLEKWTGEQGQHAAMKLEEAIYLHTQKTIHQSHTGNIPHWAQNPLMRTIFQFRFFGMGSLETQLLSNLQAGDRRMAMSFATNTFFALISYMAIMTNKYGADKEKLAEVMATEELLKGMVYRSGYFANLGGLIDTLLPMGGLDPLSPHSRSTNLTTSWGLGGSPVGQILDNAFGALSAVTTSMIDEDTDFYTSKNMRNFTGMAWGKTLPLVATVERGFLNTLEEE